MWRGEKAVDAYSAKAAKGGKFPSPQAQLGQLSRVCALCARAFARLLGISCQSGPQARN